MICKVQVLVVSSGSGFFWFCHVLSKSSSYLFHDFAEVASLCDFAKSQSFRRCAKKTSKRKEVIIWGEVRYLGEGETPILILSEYEVGSKLPIRDGHQLSSTQ